MGMSKSEQIQKSKAEEQCGVLISILSFLNYEYSLKLNDTKKILIVDFQDPLNTTLGFRFDSRRNSFIPIASSGDNKKLNQLIHEIKKRNRNELPYKLKFLEYPPQTSYETGKIRSLKNRSRKRKVKTLFGRTLTAGILITASAIVFAGGSYLKKISEKKNVTNVNKAEQSIDISLFTPKIMESVENILAEQEALESVPSVTDNTDSKIPEQIMEQKTMVSQIFYSHMEDLRDTPRTERDIVVKRQETDDYFGQEIYYWSYRYGYDYAIMASSITQERGDIIYLDSYRSDKIDNKYIPLDNNAYIKPDLGSLTEALCGEVLKVPIINPSNDDMKTGKTVDKIFIICRYPNIREYKTAEGAKASSIEELSPTEKNRYQKDLQDYHNQMLKAKQLYQKDPSIEIYNFDEIHDKNYKDNLRIACFYHAYCFRLEKNNPIEGLLKYNGGGDPNYLRNVLQFIKDDELSNLTYTTFDEEGKKVEVKLDLTLQRKQENAKENGYHK